MYSLKSLLKAISSSSKMKNSSKFDFQQTLSNLKTLDVSLIIETYCDPQGRNNAKYASANNLIVLVSQEFI